MLAYLAMIGNSRRITYTISGIAGYPITEPTNIPARNRTY